MKRILMLLAAVVCGTTLYAASAAKGSCEAKAQEVKVGWSGSVRLVDEYDPDWGEFYGTGAYYLKVPLQKGHAYTICMEGGNAEEIWMDAYAYDNWEGEVWPPSAGFFDGDTQSGKYLLWMYSDDWDSDDPNTWNYFISLSGKIGASATVSILEGIHSFLDPGLERNPKQITMKDSNQTFSGKFTYENSYFFKSNLAEGRKYLVRTTGGTDAKPYALKVVSEKLFRSEADPTGDKNNAAYIVYPDESGMFQFIVTGGVEGDAFGLVYRAIPSRTPEQHNPVSLGNGGKASFRPGPVVADTDYYDSVIDKNLFKVTVAKDERWVFDAVGADRTVLMRLYDSDGNVLAENTTVGGGSYDLRIGYDAAKAGNYYVGVCDPELAPGAAAASTAVVLTARKVTKADAQALIAPIPGTVGSNPLAESPVSEPCDLNATCWSRTFLIGGRKGQGFKLGLSFVDARSTLSLKAEAFKLGSTGKETPVELSLADITPGNVTWFEADANATYGVRVSVMDGAGLDFPAFRVHAVAYSTTGEELGVLTVQTKGADGQWTLDKEKEKYSGGVSLLLSGTHTVKFTTVKNFSVAARCASGTASGASWTGVVQSGRVATVVTGEYSDKFDPKDDVLKGATSLSISNKEKANERTLWSGDPADWFKFTAKDGVYNNFRFSKIEGDGVMSVVDANGKSIGPEWSGLKSISKLALAKGTYYLVIGHADPKAPQDGSYTLVASSVNVGAIKFAKTAVKVKDNVGEVVLTVNRTAKEGRVCVRYATADGTAKAGSDYVAQSGELVWENGDKTKRTITITTLPDLIPTYRGKDRQFKVVLTPVAATGADEYPAQITADTATVTLTETAKKGVDPYKPAKKATGKEDDKFCNGTFSGVAIAAGGGAARLANVSFTAKGDTLSAKVTIVGKAHSFSAKDGWDSAEGGFCTKALVNEKDGITLSVRVADGKTVAAGDYLTSGGTVAFDFNGAHYEGELVRDNSKVQKYLDAVVDYVGYYTVSLVPQSGVGIGYGYVTLTVDNKGKAKLGGQLADGATKVSGSSVVAIRADGSLEIPVFVGKANYCFGGLVRLSATATAYGDAVPTVDSAEGLIWNDDKAMLSGVKTAGWKFALSPVGGWYDTVINLQRYYYNQSETLSFDGVPVKILSNNMTLPKKAAGQIGSDISFTFKRATGLVSGNLTYKDTKSCKLFGVHLLTRDEAAPLDSNIEAPCFFTRKVSGAIESVSLSVLSNED